MGDKFQNNKRKRELLSELFKLVQIENSKKERLSDREKISKLKREKILQKEVEKKLNKIRKNKKREKKPFAQQIPKHDFKVGENVRMMTEDQSVLSIKLKKVKP